MLLAWEDDANLAVTRFGGNRMEIVVPSLSIVAEPSVAWVDKVVDRKGTRALAEAYLRFLYSPEAQEIEAQNFYRPLDPAVLARHADRFPRVNTFTLADMFGDWPKVQREQFGDGGAFDRLYKPGQ